MAARGGRAGARGGAGGGAGERAGAGGGGGAPRDRADLPPELLEAVARAVVSGGNDGRGVSRAGVPSRGGAGGGAPRDWADLPPELLEAVARAMPEGGRLWFRLVCRSWAAAGAAVAAGPDAGGTPLPPGKVTRTKGTDAAASGARAAEVAFAVDDSALREQFKLRLCRYAAEGGHLEALQWARAHGCPWDRWTCANAASNGHLEVLQWARAHGCPWDERTCRCAAKNGHLDVLEWARANGCPE